MILSDQQIERYARQIMLPEVGGTGQKRLLAASVLVIGVGGLASTALPILAASGVGRFTLLDDDSVEASNLARQTLYRAGDIGTAKVTAAKAFLEALNPDTMITGLAERATLATLPDLIASHDVILDGSDNHATKFLVNRLTRQAGKPLVTASAQGMTGYALAIVAAEDPCLRCLFPEGDGDAELSCNAAGVLTAAVAVVGAMQAALVSAVLLQQPLPVGQLWRYSLDKGGMNALSLTKNHQCPDCALLNP